MSWASRLVEGLVKRLKHDEAYELKTEYAAGDAVRILGYRGLQLLRGARVRWLVRQSHSPVFCGRGVVIEYGHLISAGPSLVLEDGVYLSALSEQGIRLGGNVTIGRNSILVCTGVVANRGTGIEIGDYSAVGAQSFLGGQGGISIGHDVIMGPGVRIFSENHRFDRLDVPIRKQGEVRRGVVIEGGCWIGAGVTILDGTRIGQGSVVAAGAVVSRELPAFSVAAGVPARVVRSRKGDA